MSILHPLFAMALLTFIVQPLILVTRIRSVNAGVVSMDYYQTFTGGTPPDGVLKTTRHWANLFEAPTLFYVICLIILLQQLDSSFLVWLGWAYVMFRCIHAAIHLTYNAVYHRLGSFLCSTAVLISMWVLVFMETL